MTQEKGEKKREKLHTQNEKTGVQAAIVPKKMKRVLEWMWTMDNADTQKDFEHTTPTHEHEGSWSDANKHWHFKLAWEGTLPI